MTNLTLAVITSVFSAYLNLLIYQDPLSSVVAAILTFVAVYFFCRFVDFLSKRYSEDNDPPRN